MTNFITFSYPTFMFSTIIPNARIYIQTEYADIVFGKGDNRNVQKQVEMPAECIGEIQNNDNTQYSALPKDAIMEFLTLLMLGNAP